MVPAPTRTLAVVFLLLGSLGGVAAVSGAPAAPVPVAQTDQADPDTTVMDVTIAENGDARWRVSYRIRLDDENATDAFRSLQADIRNDSDAFTGAFERRMGRTVAAATNATGREMSLRDVSVTTANESLPQPTGVVTYRFEWTAFAVVEGDTIRTGDAIDQLFLDRDTSLAVEWPAGYRLDSVTPSPSSLQDREAVWDGRLAFDPGEPRLVAVKGTPTPGADAEGGGLPLVPILAVVALALVGGAYVLARRNGWTGGGPAGDGDAGDGGGDAGDGDGQPPAAAASAGEREEPPEELLSNEERVLRLVRDNGGRMKQKRVAEELDWTAAKTSQVVGDLRDDEELEAFRLGRENVLVLPEVDGLADSSPAADAAEAGEDAAGSEADSDGADDADEDDTR
jgi:hypothetical protein